VFDGRGVSLRDVLPSVKTRLNNKDIKNVRIKGKSKSNSFEAKAFKDFYLERFATLNKSPTMGGRQVTFPRRPFKLSPEVLTCSQKV